MNSETKFDATLFQHKKRNKTKERCRSSTETQNDSPPSIIKKMIKYISTTVVMSLYMFGNILKFKCFAVVERVVITMVQVTIFGRTPSVVQELFVYEHVEKKVMCGRQNH